MATDIQDTAMVRKSINLEPFRIPHRILNRNIFFTDRTYSLPRQVAGASSHAQRFSQQPSYNEGYYTQDRRRNNTRSHHQADESATTALDKPDFYFMPSQRKYSGEVVRVYVDYNKDMKK